MALTIEQGIQKTIGVEAGYVNNPADPGGETCWGITLAVARDNGYTGPMQSMPQTEAVRIYKSKYVVAPGFDQVWMLSDILGYELFDTGVNCGVQKAGVFLQQGLNALNRNQKDYPDIPVDGKVGSQTISNLKAFLAKRGSEGVQVLLKMLVVLRGAYYLNLVVARQQDEDFIFGWFDKRINLPTR